MSVTQRFVLVAGMLSIVACGDKSDPTGPPERTVATISIAPVAPVVADGSSVQLTATLTDQDGQVFTAPPTGVTVAWSTGDAAIATIAADGEATGNRPGQTQLTATAAGRTASVTLTVTQVATTLSIVAGEDQAGDSGSELPDDLVVEVVDRHGDPVAGVTVAWSVTSGGGSVSAATASTGADGRAGARWTLGSVAGPQTVEATVTGLDGSPAAFTANALNQAPAVTITSPTDGASYETGEAVQFAGSAMDAEDGELSAAALVWTTAAGEIGTGPAFSVDNLPAGEHTITLTASDSDGAEGTDQVAITVAAPPLTCSDTVTLGAGATMHGDLPSVLITGAVTVTGSSSVCGDVLISTNGDLTIGAHTVDVAGSFATASTGRLSMQDDAALLRVAGNVEFRGRDTNGLLTAGTIEVGGDFVQRQGQSGCCSSFPHSFQASGTHTVVLNGTGAQLVDFNSGSLAADRSRFANLRIENAGAITFAGTPTVGGALDIASATTLDGAALLTVAGPLSTTAGSALLVDRIVLNGSMDVQGTFSPDTVWFDGTDQTIQGGLDYETVIVRGTAAFGGDASLSGSLAAVLTGIIDIGGNTVDVAGSLQTGRLTMQDDAALLRVAGNVTFGGRDTNGLLTAGTIEVGGDFVQRQGQSGCCSSFPRSFQASGTHTVVLNGTGAQLVDFNSGSLAADRSRFANLRIENAGAITFAGTPTVGGNLDITSAATLDGAALLTVGGSLASAAGSALIVDRFVLNGSMDVQGTFSPDTAWFDGTDQTIQGGLDYQNVVVRGTAAFGGDASLSGSLAAVLTGIIDIGGNTVDVAGSLQTGRLVMQDDAALLRVAGNVEFRGRDTNGLLTAGTIEVGGDFVQRQGQSGCCSSFPRSFEASGTHTVILNGTGAQLIDFNTGGLAAGRSRFNRLIVDNTGGVTLAGNPAVGASLELIGTMTVPAAVTLDIGGTLLLRATSVLNNNGTVTTGACTTDAGHVVNGSNPCG